MSELLAIKQAIDDLNTAFSAYRSTNDLRLRAVEKGNGPLAQELTEKLKKIEADVQKFDDLRGMLERVEDLESRARTPGLTAAPRDSKAHNPEYTRAFENWLRKRCNSPADESVMFDISRREQKDVTVASNSSGGYALPKEISMDIENMEIKLSPVRSIIPVTRVGTSDYHELVNLRGASSGWVGEGGSSRVVTATPSIRDIAPTHGEIYALPQASEWSLDDLGFNVQNWLVRNVADEFAYQEGIAVLTGNGTNKPTGMLANTPVVTDDFASPLRAANVFQYLPSVASPFSVNNNDALIDLTFKLNSSYRSGASFIMNSNTMSTVRKLKASGSGEYLFVPSLAAGTPSTLLGFPVYFLENMDDVGASKFPIGFGNWARAYLLCDRFDTRITVDNNLTSPGWVKFFVRRREAGCIRNNDAAKFIRTS